MTFFQKIMGWTARLLIRFKRLKEVRYTEAELNELILDSFPYQVDFTVPGGKAEFTVLTAQIQLGVDDAQGLTIKLLCAIDIGSMNQQLYRAHLNLTVNAQPFYHQPSQSIRIRNAKFSQLSLVHDEYLLMKSATGLLRKLTPNVLHQLVSATVGSALGMASALAVPVPEVRNYLLMFTEGNKQLILDFHRPQLEKIVKQMIDNGDLQYQLQHDDFEEKLFADMGRTLTLDNHQLVFKF